MKVALEPTDKHKEVPGLRTIKDKIINQIGYDAGLKKTRIYRDETERPAHLFNRSFFISETLDQISEKADSQVSFLMFDLADTYFANQSGAGDLVLNRFARHLVNVVDEIKKQDASLLINNSINIGRYGGDEFCVSIVGQSTKILVEKLKQRIQAKFTDSKEIYGYYQRGLDTDDVKKEPIRLKKRDDGEQIDVMNRPQGGEERMIFDFFLNRGTILNEEQIKTIQKSGLFESLRGQGIKREIKYPQEVGSDFKKKLKYIKERFPILGLSLNHLTEIGNYSDKQRQEILFFLEDRVFDRLLGNVVYSIPEFIENLPTYRRLYSFDLKFIREANEILSYVEADMMIEELWKKIEQKLGSKHMRFIDIARRGGSFLIGVHKMLTPSLQQEIHQILTADEMKNLTLDLRNKKTIFHIGSSFSRLSREAIVNRKESFNINDFNSLLESTQEEFCRNMIEYLSNSSDNKSSNLENIFDRDFNKNNVAYDPLYALIIEFLTGKRAFFRGTELNKYISPEQPKYKQLKSVIQLVLSKSEAKIKEGQPINQYELFEGIRRLLTSPQV